MRRSPQLLTCRMIVVPAVLGLLLVVAACGGGDGTATASSWSTVTDTIGDTVVVRTVGARDSAALLDLVPELQIGRTDGPEEYTFGYVGQIVPAPNGDVYVWDSQAGLLRRYDSSGTFVRQIGRKGGGPGEYDDPNGLDVMPDGRLLIWDGHHQRVNVYDTTGTFLTSWRAATNNFLQQGLRGDSAGRVNLRMAVGGRDDSWYPTIGIVRYTPDGTLLDTLTPPALPTPGMLFLESGEGESRSRTRIYIQYVPQPSSTVSPLGYLVSTPADRYAITLAIPGGTRRIERDIAPVPVEAAERSQIERRLTRMIQRSTPAWRWNGPPVPEQKPPVGSLTVDDDGRIWVGRSFASERVENDGADTSSGPVEPRWHSASGYDVFAPGGRWLGHLPLPRGTTLLHMRGDTAWGTMSDSLDVQRVLRFRITGIQ